MSMTNEEVILRLEWDLKMAEVSEQYLLEKDDESDAEELREIEKDIETYKRAIAAIKQIGDDSRQMKVRAKPYTAEVWQLPDSFSAAHAETAPDWVRELKTSEHLVFNSNTGKWYLSTSSYLSFAFPGDYILMSHGISIFFCEKSVFDEFYEEVRE